MRSMWCSQLTTALDALKRLRAEAARTGFGPILRLPPSFIDVEMIQAELNPFLLIRDAE